MPNPHLGSNYSLPQLLKAYDADPLNDPDADYLLYRGDEILALCLRQKFHPTPGEVWIGNNPGVADWGRKLAALKDKATLPLYYLQRGRTLYQYKGHQLIAGDTDDPQELANRKSPVPLSRIVFITPVASATVTPHR